MVVLEDRVGLRNRLSSRASHKLALDQLINMRHKKLDIHPDSVKPASCEPGGRDRRHKGSGRFCKTSVTNLAEGRRGELNAGTQKTLRTATDRRICKQRRTGLMSLVYTRSSLPQGNRSKWMCADLSMAGRQIFLCSLSVQRNTLRCKLGCFCPYRSTNF